LGLYPRAAIAKGAHCDFKKVLGLPFDGPQKIRNPSRHAFQIEQAWPGKKPSIQENGRKSPLSLHRDYIEPITPTPRK